MDASDTTGKNGADGVEKRPVRGGIAGRKDYARDKLTNGSKTLPDTDGRLRVARRFRDIAAAILVDQGGFDACSDAEDREGRLARGEEVDIERHALLCS